MPGRFDNLGANIAGGLSGFGGLLGSIGRGIAGGQNYNTMSQAMGPQGALLAQTNPEAFQTLLFMQRLNDWQRQNPGKDINEAFYRLSPKGQEEQYGRPPGIVSAGEGVSLPAYMLQQPAAGVQAQPSQQPQPPQAQGPADAIKQIIAPLQDIGARGQAVAQTAKNQANAAQQYPAALTTAQDAVKRLEAFRDNPDLPTIVGGPLGLKGRTAPIGQTQADLVNEASELQGKIINNTLNASRSVSGRPVNPGTLKELTAGAGDLVAGRKGTLEGYKTTINNSIDLIKKETQAAWEATGRAGTEPTWGPAAQSTPKQQYPEGTVAHNKQTGETRVMRAGKWQ